MTTLNERFNKAWNAMQELKVNESDEMAMKLLVQELCATQIRLELLEEHVQKLNTYLLDMSSTLKTVLEGLRGDD